MRRNPGIGEEFKDWGGIHGLRDQRIEGSKDPGIQESKEYRNPRIQESMDTGIQGYMNPRMD